MQQIATVEIKIEICVQTSRIVLSCRVCIFVIVYHIDIQYRYVYQWVVNTNNKTIFFLNFSTFPYPYMPHRARIIYHVCSYVHRVLEKRYKVHYVSIKWTTMYLLVHMYSNWTGADVISNVYVNNVYIIDVNYNKIYHSFFLLKTSCLQLWVKKNNGM